MSQEENTAADKSEAAPIERHRRTCRRCGTEFSTTKALRIFCMPCRMLGWNEEYATMRTTMPKDTFKNDLEYIRALEEYIRFLELEKVTCDRIHKLIHPKEYTENGRSEE